MSDTCSTLIRGPGMQVSKVGILTLGAYYRLGVYYQHCVVDTGHSVLIFYGGLLSRFYGRANHCLAHVQSGCVCRLTAVCRIEE